MPDGGIAFIGDIDSVLGFRALGVETLVPGETEEAREMFQSLVKANTSVIMITEDLIDDLKDLIDDTLNRPLPAVVVLPGITGTQKRGEDSIRELIIRAVGVDLMTEDQ